MFVSAKTVMHESKTLHILGGCKVILKMPTTYYKNIQAIILC